MPTYKLCSVAGVGQPVKEEIDEFTEEEYKDYEDGKLDKGLEAEFSTQAAEQQHFEWWIEKTDD